MAAESASYSVTIRRAGTALTHNGAGPDSFLIAPLEWRTGRDFGAQSFPTTIAGKATVHLINDEGEWSQVEFDDQVEISMSVGTNTSRMWTGFVDQIEETDEHGGRRRLTLRCLGNLQRFNAKKVTIAEMTDVEIEDALAALIEALGLPASLKGVVTSTDIIPTFSADDENGLDVARKIETTMAGVLYENAMGQISLEGFEARASAGGADEFVGYHAFKGELGRERDFIALQGTTTAGDVVRVSSETITDATEFVDLPDSFIATQSVMTTILDRLISLGQFGQEPYELRWVAGNDYDQARQLEIGQIFCIISPVLNSVIAIEGMRHRVWNGGYHDIELTVTDANAYTNLFFADISLTDDTAIMP